MFYNECYLLFYYACSYGDNLILTLSLILSWVSYININYHLQQELKTKFDQYLPSYLFHIDKDQTHQDMLRNCYVMKLMWCCTTIRSPPFKIFPWAKMLLKHYSNSIPQQNCCKCHLFATQQCVAKLLIYHTKQINTSELDLNQQNIILNDHKYVMNLCSYQYVTKN